MMFALASTGILLRGTTSSSPVVCASEYRKPFSGHLLDNEQPEFRW